MIIRQFHGWNASLVIFLFVLLRLVAFVKASQGDRLPEFRRCISVRLKDSSQIDDCDAQFDEQICVEENCKNGDSAIREEPRPRENIFECC